MNGNYVFSDEEGGTSLGENSSDILHLSGSHIHQTHNDNLRIFAQQLIYFTKGYRGGYRSTYRY